MHDYLKTFVIGAVITFWFLICLLVIGFSAALIGRFACPLPSQL
jgi:hypothetical protein